jgi:hypothetical protein
MYMVAVLGATLERAMYTFHRLHHALSLPKIAFLHLVRHTYGDVEQKGAGRYPYFDGLRKEMLKLAW